MSLTLAQTRRYARQIALPEVGGAGQARLLAARARVAGDAGAQPAVEAARIYLVAAGVGRVLDGATPPDDGGLLIQFASASPGRAEAASPGGPGGPSVLVRGGRTPEGLVLFCTFAGPRPSGAGPSSGLAESPRPLLAGPLLDWPWPGLLPLSGEKAVLLGVLAAAEGLWGLLGSDGPGARRLTLPEGRSEPQIEVWSSLP